MKTLDHAGKLDIGLVELGKYENKFNSGQVTWHGSIPRCELSNLYSRCKVLVHPSRGESFGLIYLEAYAGNLGVITLAKSGSTAEVVASFFGAGNTAISVTGSISEGSTVLKPGSWSFKTAADSEKVFCGYLDLAIEIKSKTCYEGETCSFEGAVTRNGRPVDFSVYKSQDLKYGLVNLSRGDVSYSNLQLGQDGKFKGNFNPAGFKDSEGLANLKVTLNVITQSGYKFTFSAIQNVQVLPPGLYPEIQPNPISKSDFSQQLLGKNGKALATLTLVGPSRTSGEVCFNDLKVRTDPDPERVNGYETRLDGKDLKTQ